MRTANLKEWIGKTDDSRIPDYIRVRVMQKAGDKCAKCTRKINEGLKGEVDHIIPLIVGGGHRESNLQLLCVACHKGKTKLDQKVKARSAKYRRRNLVDAKKSKGRPMPGSVASGWKKKMDGSVVRR